jgi:hypothetical protein
MIANKLENNFFTFLGYNHLTLPQNKLKFKLINAENFNNS